MSSTPPDTYLSPYSSLRQTMVVVTLAFAGMTAAFTQTVMIPIQGRLPELLNAPASQTAWVITATLLAASVCTPIAGKLGDMFGKRRTMIVLMTTLIIASLICAVSPNLLTVIIGRALQGASMGVIPLGMSLLRDVMSPRRLGTSIAIVSATLGVGAAIGLPLSAVVAENLEWHMLFVFSAGLAAICLALMIAIVPSTQNRTPGKIDFVGVAGLSVGLVGVLLAISRGNDWGWTSTPTLASAIVGAVTLVLWGIYEWRVANPLVDLRVSSRPAVLMTNLASVAMGFALFSSNVAFPQLLQLPEAIGGMGMGLIPASLALMPAGLAMLAMSPIAGRIVRVSGPRVLLVIGALVIAVAYVGSIVIPLGFWVILFINMVIGIGIGLGYAAMPAQIMAVVPRNETGAANGLNTLMRSFGTAVAAAVVGAILSSADHTNVTSADHTNVTSAFTSVFVLGLIAALACAAFAFAIPQRAMTEGAAQPEAA